MFATNGFPEGNVTEEGTYKKKLSVDDTGFVGCDTKRMDINYFKEAVRIAACISTYI